MIKKIAAIYPCDNILESRGQRAGGKRVSFDRVGSDFSIWGEFLTFDLRGDRWDFVL